MELAQLTDLCMARRCQLCVGQAGESLPGPRTNSLEDHRARVSVSSSFAVKCRKSPEVSDLESVNRSLTSLMSGNVGQAHRQRIPGLSLSLSSWTQEFLILTDVYLWGITVSH